MEGGGLCWLDYDDDGWLDLYVVNSYAEQEVAQWKAAGGLPRSALFHNDDGKFEDVSAGSGADVEIRGNGCVAADLDLDGDTDLYVTTARSQVLLWNEGDGKFREGARAAGVDAYGWRTGAAVGDVNGDGWPDIFVAGYADMNSDEPRRDSGASPAPRSASATSSSSSNGRTRRPGHVPRGRAAGRPRGVEVRVRPRRALHGPRRRRRSRPVSWRTTRTPTACTRTSPGRAGRRPIPTGSASGSRSVRARRASPTRAPAWASRPATTTATGAPTSSSPTRAARSTACSGATRPTRTTPPSRTCARELGARLRRARPAGVSRGPTSTSTRISTSSCERRRAGHRPRRGRRAAPGLREPTARASGTFVDVSAATGPRPTVGDLLARGSAAADYDNDGDLDVAVSQIGGPLVLLAEPGHGEALARGRAGRLPSGRASSPSSLPDGRKLRARRTPAAATSRPRIRASTSASATADRRSELVVRWPGGKETRLDDVQANQLVEVKE